MKKFLSLALVVIMMLACIVTVYAGNATISDSQNGTATVTIRATKAKTTFHVLVQWEDLTFTYNEGTWDEKTHTYGGEAIGWDDKDGKVITIENHSNAAVSVTATLSPTNAQNGVTVSATSAVTAGQGSVSNLSITLDSADDDAYRDSTSSTLNDQYRAGPTGFFTINVTGTPTNIKAGETVDVGTVTITITAAAPTP